MYLLCMSGFNGKSVVRRGIAEVTAWKCKTYGMWISVISTCGADISGRNMAEFHINLSNYFRRKGHPVRYILIKDD